MQCKEWGFLLREMFGNKLGTGDYGHMTIEHVSMLMRNFLNLREYPNQGFEAAHSLQRQLLILRQHRMTDMDIPLQVSL